MRRSRLPRCGVTCLPARPPACLSAWRRLLTHFSPCFPYFPAAAASQPLGVSLEEVRRRHTQFLLTCEQDVRAEEQLSLLRDRRAVAPHMLRVAQQRLRAIVMHLRRHPRHAANLATLSAATIRWVCSSAAAAPDAAAAVGGSEEKGGGVQRTPSLQAAHNLCLLAASLLEQGSEQHRRCVEMADLSEKLLLQLRGVER